MAVVQISRIQQRRGKKQDGTGLPQLASAEFAWCVDTQELFIGNGSVAEGSPAVGNTKVLTEKDDIFNLIGTYQFAKNVPYIQTGVDATHPVRLSIQDIIDQFITSSDFGVVGDGATDDTAAIQRAIDQLFLNPATQGEVPGRVELMFGPGVYKITGTLYVPSYATITGAGKEKTIFSFTNSGAMIQFINDSSTIANRSVLNTTTGLNQPKFITMKGFTFTTTANNQIGLQLDAVSDSLFTDIKVVGGWTQGAGVAASKGLQLAAVSQVVTCERNIFSNVEVTGFSSGIWSKFDIGSNKFDDLYLHSLFQGVVLGYGSDLFNPGQQFGPRNVIVQRSYFENIQHHGFIVYNGTGNISFENRFVNVGSGGAGNTQAVYAHVDFHTVGNSTINDRSDREYEMEVGQTYSAVPYVGAVNGHALRESFGTKQIDVSYAPKTLAFRLPIPLKDQAIPEGAASMIGYEITYTYRSTTNSQSRFGKLLINVDVAHHLVQLVDDYEWVGASGHDVDLTFTAELIDSNIDSYTDSIGVFYTNVQATDTASVMYYSYRSIA
jgi:hypothetical protein